jgi:hypothetical protein
LDDVDASSSGKFILNDVYIFYNGKCVSGHKQTQFHPRGNTANERQGKMRLKVTCVGELNSFETSSIFQGGCNQLACPFDSILLSSLVRTKDLE